MGYNYQCEDIVPSVPITLPETKETTYVNDYPFGNKLLSLRTKSGMTQRQVASHVGVTDKAVSKWETGSSKPTTNALCKLAALYGTNVSELLDMRDGRPVKSITKIVITGGPCAGKSTAMSWIQEEFSKRGYGVLFVPETATELIMSGVAPWFMPNTDFQRCVLRWQLDKEDVFEQVAQSLPQDKILIVCDRGAMDGRAYMTQPEFTSIMNDTGMSEIELRDEYDAVFHLVTAANGAEEYYTTSNNSARTETPEQARELDERLISAWTGHPHLRVIGNEQSFKDKMLALISEIASFLGEPEPYEIERKFLISYPDTRWLESNPACQKVEIIQTYLNSGDGEETRVRQRGADGNYVYTMTKKRTISGIKRVEVEKRLSQAEYLNLLMEADTSRHPIRKTRYCLTYDNQYFEIDVYPFWNNKAIVEIELSDEGDEIRMPPQIEVIREVTDDQSYKNSALALI